MKPFFVFFVVTTVLYRISAELNVVSNHQCKINPSDKSITKENLKNHCSIKQLRNIFTRLTSGSFPSNGRYQGYVITCFNGPCDWLGEVWNGKNIFYEGGTARNNHGLVTNIYLDGFVWTRSKIFRTNAPIDGEDVYELGYRGNIFTYFIVDYIREVQKNLYLGIATLRHLQKHPIVFFMLEKVE